MAFKFRIRDLIRPRRNILKEVGLKPGFRVLDFGCGPGGYVAVTARMVGSTGEVIALDRNPLAIQFVENLIARKRLGNVRTIQSDGPTRLPDSSIDVVLLYDILHHLPSDGSAFRELHRVLKPDGILSVRDHHMQEADICSRMEEGDLFAFSQKGCKTYSFRKKL